MTAPKCSRRKFLTGSAAAALSFTILPRHVLGADQPAPSAKLNIACIGVSGRGGAHVDAAQRENIVALCDVDKNSLAKQAKRFPNAKTFSDYRKLFDTMAKDIDAVMIATPDHHHAAASMLAIHAGKHVYCEKPLTHSVWEARQVAESARKAKVATQMGNGGMSSEGTRLLKEWINAGAIGPVREVHIWTDRPIWPQGLAKRPATLAVPPTLDWDLWLGPAPARDYHDFLHPFKWRGWWDFGTGALGDIGCHSMAPVFYALDLKYPTSIQSETSGTFDDCAPAWSIITYEFPARGEKPPVKLVWYDGKKLPPRPAELEAERNLKDNGTLLYGDNGKILFDGLPRIIPEAKMKAFVRPEPSIPRIPKGDHFEDFFIACRGSRPASSNFDFAGPLAETVLAGNVAIRVGKRLEWDGPNMKATNAPEADKYIRRSYRDGWRV